MPAIKVSKAHNKPLPEVRELANGIAAKLKKSYDVSARWKTDNQLSFKRSGLSGDLKITHSNVIIELELSFLLSSFAATIEQQIRKHLDEKLA